MVKPGYKQTEVGLIPEEWSIKPLKEVAPLQRGFDLPYSSIKEGRYPVVFSNGIGAFHSSYMVKGPGVVTGRSGTIGKIHYVEDDYWPHNTALWVTDFHDNDPLFIFYLFRTIPWNLYNSGSGVPTLNRNDVHDYLVSVPTKKEQINIAILLADSDNLIDSLEKQLAKKKAIKQGAMQELLTGKRRLPGFSGKWENRPISFFGNFVSGNCFPIKYQGCPSGQLPFYKVSDFNIAGNNRVMERANNYISYNVASLLSCKIIPRDSIVFAKIGAAISLERKRVTGCDCCIDNNMMSFQPYHKDIAIYMCYLLQTIRFGEFVEATALPSLSGKTIGEIQRTFPPTIEEQIAIATVLSDMDSEIEALEQKLAKYRQVKQGMMQQLLTGKIRLV